MTFSTLQSPFIVVYPNEPGLLSCKRFVSMVQGQFLRANLFWNLLCPPSHSRGLEKHPPLPHTASERSPFLSLMMRSMCCLGRWHCHTWMVPECWTSSILSVLQGKPGQGFGHSTANSGTAFKPKIALLQRRTNHINSWKAGDCHYLCTGILTKSEAAGGGLAIGYLEKHLLADSGGEKSTLVGTIWEQGEDTPKLLTLR